MFRKTLIGASLVGSLCCSGTVLVTVTVLNFVTDWEFA